MSGLITLSQPEKFPLKSEKCMCCNTRYHIYLFPLVGNERQTKVCISCKRDCRGYKLCQLGKLWTK